MLKNQKFKIKPRTGHPRNSVFPGGDPPVPDQVTGVQITGTTSSSVSASWNSANGATSYNIYVNDSLHTGGITLTSATISGLSSNTTYQISVAGQNSIGEGLRSSNMPATTQQIVSGARNRQLHPFPSDDPFNMPIGANAWYGAHGSRTTGTGDAATVQFNTRGFHTSTGENGWSFVVFHPTNSDPVHSFNRDPNDPNNTRRSKHVYSYRPEEDLQPVMYERLQLNADTVSNINGTSGYFDDYLTLIKDNDFCEFFRFRRYRAEYPDPVDTVNYKMARNRLDRYSWSRYGYSHPMANEMGTRAAGTATIAGLVRLHEIHTSTPHIPHAISMVAHRDRQQGSAGHYERALPPPPDEILNANAMFPAHQRDARHWPTPGTDLYEGCMRNGMRFALDPAVCTDAWIMANAPKMKINVPKYGIKIGDVNPWQVAIAKALRDYGSIVCDQGQSTNTLYFEAVPEKPVSDAIRELQFDSTWRSTLVQRMRRVAGRMSPGGTVVHNPGLSHWQTWANNGEGWGGGAPRVPYSPPL
jgi:hypothetical protein